jgi:hypothetical protein
MNTRYLLYAALWLLLGCPMAASQALWAPTASGVSVETIKPMLSLGPHAQTSFLSTATFLSVRSPLSSEVRVVTEVPIAHLGMSYSWLGQAHSESSTGLGNPYLGVEYTPLGSGIVVEAGLRAPLASRTEAAMLLGMLADPDRMEAFTPDYASATLAANVMHANGDGIRFRGRVAPTVLYYTHEQYGSGAQRWPDTREIVVS